jgi:tRNA (guanine26-N2/guanine27-N2)-dimethyltransferase
MPQKPIVEGKARLFLPRKREAFFNPAMESNRTITVALLNKLFKKPFSACDSLTGIGAKGIRIALETKARKVVLNDLNQNALPITRKNVKANRVSRKCIVTWKDANALLSENLRGFDFVDVDPFGSPAPFTDSAVRALNPDGGLLGLTATDTGALNGSFKDPALRRYGVLVDRTSFYNEFGARALAGFAVREAAKHDVGLRPVFCHATLHYLRAFLRAERSASSANAAVKQVKWLRYCLKCDNREYAPRPEARECHGAMMLLGPIWAGKIFEINLFNELDTELPYYDLHILQKKWGVQFGRFSNVENALNAAGFKASRTHFNPHAIRTDAPFDELRKAIA